MPGSGGLISSSAELIAKSGAWIAREDLLKQMLANGFQLVKEHTFLPYQYFLVFTVN
jgi:hypothetical protein